MTQKRITPEMVKAAYEKSGLRPERGCLCRKILSGVFHGCDLGAVYFEKTGTSTARHCEIGIGSTRNAYAWIAQEFGKEYSDSFRRAFDGGYSGRGEDPTGWADGQACAAAVFPKN